MKVLLINPPYMRLADNTIHSGHILPLGLQYIATFAVKNGYNVKIYDSEASGSNKGKYPHWKELFFVHKQVQNSLNNDSHPVWKEIENRIIDEKPNVVGLQVMSIHYPTALKVAGIVKKVSEDIITVMGHHHPTIFPEDVLSGGKVDYVVRGEAEYTFTKLLGALAGKGKVKDILGISYIDDNRIIHNPDRPIETNLDALGYPERELFMKANELIPDDFHSVMSARGCPFPCTFCGTSNMWGKKVRYRSVPHIIEEMKKLKAFAEDRLIVFQDDSFTLNRKRTMELIKGLIDEFGSIPWSCNTRFDLLDEELLHWMKKSGCVMVSIGVETGSERILQLLQKELNKDQIRKQRKLIKDAGISLNAFFMLGLPTETKETMYETLDFMLELAPQQTHFTIFGPQPNTRLYQMLIDSGRLKEIDWANYSQQNIDNFYVTGMTKEEFHDVVMDISQKFRNYRKSLQLKHVIFYREMSKLKSNGDLENALKGFGRIIKSDRAEVKAMHAGAMFHRGEIYTALKKYDNAKMEFEKCLQLTPKHRNARESLKKLAVRTTT